MQDEQFHSHILDLGKEIHGSWVVSADQPAQQEMLAKPPTSRVKKLKLDLDVGHIVFSLLSVEALGVDSVKQDCDVTRGVFWPY